MRCHFLKSFYFLSNSILYALHSSISHHMKKLFTLILLFSLFSAQAQQRTSAQLYEDLKGLKLSNPLHFAAVGFGSGLPNVAPGTFGTIAAVPIYYLLSFLSLEIYIVVYRLEMILFLFLFLFNLKSNCCSYN